MKTRWTRWCSRFGFLTLHSNGRAWKGHDWSAMESLYQKGLILDPVGRAISVVLTEAGEKCCTEQGRHTLTFDYGINPHSASADPVEVSQGE